MARTVCAVIALGALVPAGVLALSVQTTPVPKPFPGSTSASPPAPAGPPTPPAGQAPILRPAPPSAQSGVPTDAMLGVPGVIYPTAEFLEAIDIGKGQHCYLFGTDATFAEMVAYYKQVLKDGGRELFKAPAMQQFDLGKFQEQTMAYQPSVVVKDYAFGAGEGYLHINGTKERRFKTIVQIVPPPGR